MDPLALKVNTKQKADWKEAVERGCENATVDRKIFVFQTINYFIPKGVSTYCPSFKRAEEKEVGKK
jgi:hypothetical protein